MEQVILIIHMAAAVAIIALILLQQGKGADMGASFGAGGSNTVFGPAGSGNVLTRATGILATVFFITSFGMAIVAKDKANSVVNISAGIPQVEVQQAQPAPVAEDVPAADVPDAVVSPAPDSDIPE